MVSVVGSFAVVRAEGNQLPDLKAVAKAVLRVQSQGSRASAPSGSSASRAYMSASHASQCSRNAALTRKVGKHEHQCQIASRQEPGPQFAHQTGRSPRGQEHRGMQVKHRLHYHAGPDLYCRCDCFTKSQLCIIFCLLLCIHKWIGQEHTKVRTCEYFWATARLSKGIYKRRRYTQSRQIRETRFHEQTPASNLNIVSRTGPKSSSHHHKVSTRLFIMLLLCLIHDIGATRVMAEARAVADTSAATGAVSRPSSGMPTRSENTGEARRALANGLRWTAKRALRRARARAEKEGGAKYRGRWCAAEQLNQTRKGVAHFSNEEPRNNTNPRASAAKHRIGKRIQCISFSISGASSSAWQECMAWLQDNQQHIDVALVQETHWKGEGSRDFVSGPWFVVTTGATSSDSKAGLAVLIHNRLGGPEQISAQTHLQGRLMRVRTHQGDNSIDVINLYQHVWRSQLDKEGNTKCKESVWKKLRQVTTKIPQRNTLIVGGDFNCTIRRMRHHIGSAITEAREPSSDQEEFLGYLQDHGVALLNTWNAKPAYTCQTGDAQTQIDFIICREQRADKLAKDSRPWHQAPVGRWKANHHIPVWASVRQIDPGKLPPKRQCKSYKKHLKGRSNCRISKLNSFKLRWTEKFRS